MLVQELVGEEMSGDASRFRPREGCGAADGTGVLVRAELAGVDAEEDAWQLAGFFFSGGAGDGALDEPVEPSMDAKKEETNLEALRGRPLQAACACTGSSGISLEGEWQSPPGSTNLPFAEGSGRGSGHGSGASSNCSASSSVLPGICRRAAFICRRASS